MVKAARAAANAPSNMMKPRESLLDKGLGLAKKLLGGEGAARKAAPMVKRSVQNDALDLDRRNQALSGVRRK